MLDAHVSELIGRIYAHGGDHATLAAVIDEVVAATGSRTAMLSISDTTGGRHEQVSFHGRMGHRQDDAFGEYAQYRYADDPSFAFVAANPGRGMLSSAHDLGDPLCPSDFRRWMRDAGIANWLLRYTGDARATFAISLHIGDDRAPHDDRESALFALLFPHFDNAVRIAARPAILDVADDAMIVVGAGGALRAANAAADALLAARDGLCLDRGAVRPVAASERGGFDRLVAVALHALDRGGCGGTMALARPGGGRGLALRVQPLPPQAGLGGALRGALLRIVDLDRMPPPGAVDRWRQYWQLTPAEARAAAALVETGCDLRAAGDRLGVRYATMRTYVALLLAKTGASGQPELMRLLTRLAG